MCKILREVLRSFNSLSVDFRIDTHSQIIHRMQTPWQFLFAGSQLVSPMLS